jgi:hypothetical protein
MAFMNRAIAELSAREDLSKMSDVEIETEVSKLFTGYTKTEGTWPWNNTVREAQYMLDRRWKEGGWMPAQTVMSTYGLPENMKPSKKYGVYTIGDAADAKAFLESKGIWRNIPEEERDNIVGVNIDLPALMDGGRESAVRPITAPKFDIGFDLRISKDGLFHPKVTINTKHGTKEVQLKKNDFGLEPPADLVADAVIANQVSFTEISDDPSQSFLGFGPDESPRGFRPKYEITDAESIVREFSQDYYKHYDLGALPLGSDWNEKANRYIRVNFAGYRDSRPLYVPKYELAKAVEKKLRKKKK